jgi:hypothetical protein
MIRHVKDKHLEQAPLDTIQAIKEPYFNILLNSEAQRYKEAVNIIGNSYHECQSKKILQRTFPYNAIKAFFNNSWADTGVLKDDEEFNIVAILALRGHHNVVKHIIDLHPISLMWISPVQMRSVFHYGVMGGNLDLVKLIYSKIPLPERWMIHTYDRKFARPIDYAFNNNHTNIVKYFVDNGIYDIYGLDNIHHTSPLLFYSLHNIELVRYLYLKDKNIIEKSVNADGCTVFHVIAYNYIGKSNKTLRVDNAVVNFLTIYGSDQIKERMDVNGINFKNYKAMAKKEPALNLEPFDDKVTLILNNKSLEIGKKAKLIQKFSLNGQTFSLVMQYLLAYSRLDLVLPFITRKYSSFILKKSLFSSEGLDKFYTKANVHNPIFVENTYTLIYFAVYFKDAKLTKAIIDLDRLYAFRFRSSNRFTLVHLITLPMDIHYFASVWEHIHTKFNILLHYADYILRTPWEILALSDDPKAVDIMIYLLKRNDLKLYDRNCAGYTVAHLIFRNKIFMDRLIINQSSYGNVVIAEDFYINIHPFLLLKMPSGSTFAHLALTQKEALLADIVFDGAPILLLITEAVQLVRPMAYSSLKEIPQFENGMDLIFNSTGHCEAKNLEWRAELVGEYLLINNHLLADSFVFYDEEKLNRTGVLFAESQKILYRLNGKHVTEDYLIPEQPADIVESIENIDKVGIPVKPVAIQPKSTRKKRSKAKTRVPKVKEIIESNVEKESPVHDQPEPERVVMVEEMVELNVPVPNEQSPVFSLPGIEEVEVEETPALFQNEKELGIGTLKEIVKEKIRKKRQQKSGKGKSKVKSVDVEANYQSSHAVEEQTANRNIKNDDYPRYIKRSHSCPDFSTIASFDRGRTRSVGRDLDLPTLPPRPELLLESLESQLLSVADCTTHEEDSTIYDTQSEIDMNAALCSPIKRCIRKNEEDVIFGIDSESGSGSELSALYVPPIVENAVTHRLRHTIASYGMYAESLGTFIFVPTTRRNLKEMLTLSKTVVQVLLHERQALSAILPIAHSNNEMSMTYGHMVQNLPSTNLLQLVLVFYQQMLTASDPKKHEKQGGLKYLEYVSGLVLWKSTILLSYHLITKEEMVMFILEPFEDFIRSIEEMELRVLCQNEYLKALMKIDPTLWSSQEREDILSKAVNWGYYLPERIQKMFDHLLPTTRSEHGSILKEAFYMRMFESERTLLVLLNEYIGMGLNNSIFVRTLHTKALNIHTIDMQRYATVLFQPDEEMFHIYGAKRMSFEQYDLLVEGTREFFRSIQSVDDWHFWAASRILDFAHSIMMMGVIEKEEYDRILLLVHSS